MSDCLGHLVSVSYVMRSVKHDLKIFFRLCIQYKQRLSLICQGRYKDILSVPETR